MSGCLLAAEYDKSNRNVLPAFKSLQSVMDTIITLLQQVGKVRGF
jgi:hypothetical protein